MGGYDNHYFFACVLAFFFSSFMCWLTSNIRLQLLIFVVFRFKKLKYLPTAQMMHVHQMLYCHHHFGINWVFSSIIHSTFHYEMWSNCMDLILDWMFFDLNIFFISFWLIFWLINLYLKSFIQNSTDVLLFNANLKMSYKYWALRWIECSEIDDKKI